MNDRNLYKSAVYQFRMKNVVQKRTIRNSIERVDKYLQDNQEFVALNQIALDLNLQFASIKKCIETLQKLDRVEVATNGNVTLIKSKSNQNGTAK